MLRVNFRRPGLMSFSAALALACLVGASPVRASGEAGEQGGEVCSISAATSLLERDLPVEAKAMLERLSRAATSSEDRARILELIGLADRRIMKMSDVEVSLQTGGLALSRGDLRMAETYALSASRSDRATPEDQRRATELLVEIARTRGELTAWVVPTLEQARAHWDGGRYAECKACLSSIVRSGVALTTAQRQTLDEYQARILAMEAQTGARYDMAFAPGQVLRAAGAIVASTVPAGAETPAGAGGAVTVATTAVQDGSDPLDAAADSADRGRVDEMLSEADQLYRNSRMQEARQIYQRLLAQFGHVLTDAEAQFVNDRVRATAAQLGGEPTGLLEQEAGMRDAIRQQAIAEVQNAMSLAEQATAAGDFITARSQAAQARFTWNNANRQGVLSEAQYRERMQQISELLSRIEMRADDVRRQDLLRTSEEQRIAAEEAARRAATQRDERINENLVRIRALQMEQKYEEALQAVEQILFLDPTHPAALLMKDILRDVIHYREWERINTERPKSFTAESLTIFDATIIPGEIMTFPSDWPALTTSRAGVISFTESEADREVLATLDRVRIPANFTDAALSDVLDYIATVTNVNHDVDWASMEELGIARDERVSLELREVPARVVLDRVLEKVSPDDFAKAGWAVNDGILIVASDQALRKNTFIVIYDIRDLLFQIPNYGNVPTLDLDSILDQGQQGGGGGGGSSFFEDENEQDAGDSLTEQELMEKILEIIQTNVDWDGWRDNGGDTGIVQELNGNLIITNTASNHRQIQGLLNQLREIRSIQVNVETRFLIVNQDWFEKIGFDVDVIFNADNNQFQSADRQTRAFGIGTLANEGSPLLPSDLIATRTGEVTGYVPTPGSDPVEYGFDTVPFAVVAPDPLSMIPVQQGSDSLAETLISGAFASEILALNPALGVAGTFLDDVQVDFLIEATQADRRNVSLTAPRLTFTNGRAANVSVVRQTAFVSDLTPVVGTGSVAFDPEVDVVNSGFSLLVRGVVSADRRYVTLTIQTGISQLEEFATGQVFATAAGQGDGGAASEPVPGNFQLPVVSVTQINTGATIPDKGTMLIGGQRLTTDIEVETGVPVLSKIPILNRFFTNRIESKEESTLLILVKPTIIIQREAEDNAFPGLLDSVENPFLR